MYNMALLLQHLSYADAAAAWRSYLGMDGGTASAAHARRAMKYCEMQLADAAASSGS